MGSLLHMSIMETFLYNEGIQLTAAYSGGRCSDLTQEEELERYLSPIARHIF